MGEGVREEDTLVAAALLLLLCMRPRPRASQRGGQHGIVVLQLFVLRFNGERALVVLFGLIELREAE